VFTALIAIVLAVGFGMLYSGGSAAAYAELSPSQQAGFDPAGTSLQGAVFLAQLAVGILGVLIVSSEYASGTIRTTLAAVPRRGRLLAAKTAVLGAITFGVGQVAALATFIAGQRVIASIGAPYATIAQPDVLRAIIGAGVYLTLIAWLGMALAVLLRTTPGAIAVLVANTFVAFSFAPLLGQTFARYWPTIAGIAITSRTAGPGDVSPRTGLVLLCGFVAVMLGVAYTAFRTRDA
jgi:ABC-type transport system involved in multi-copper enzyme maturation permease subunit